MENVQHDSRPGSPRAPAASVAAASFAAGAVSAPEDRLRLVSRLTWLALFLVPTAVLITAALLTPSSEGHGTHTQLGLPPCGFLVFTGFPCPGCGLTTAFAHMIRGEVVGAAAANPFGVPLFLVTALTIPIAATGVVRGWPVVETLERLGVDRFALGLAVTSVLVWVTRVAVLLLLA